MEEVSQKKKVKEGEIDFGEEELVKKSYDIKAGTVLELIKRANVDDKESYGEAIVVNTDKKIFFKNDSWFKQLYTSKYYREAGDEHDAFG